MDAGDEVDADVLDADGNPVGRIEGQDVATLARHLLIHLDDDAREALAVDEDLVDLPAMLIRRRSDEEIHLTRNLDELKELLSELDELEG